MCIGQNATSLKTLIAGLVQLCSFSFTTCHEFQEYWPTLVHHNEMCKAFGMAELYALRVINTDNPKSVKFKQSNCGIDCRKFA
jgi:hypothetical protein